MKTKEIFLNIATGIATTCTLLVTVVVLYRQFVPQAVAGQVKREDRPVADWQQQIALGRRIGPSTAAVTLVEYGDFECPACAAFFHTTERVRTAHPNDLSIAFRHAPLSYHRQAYPSARAAECAANQGHFEKMYQTLYSWRDSLGHVAYRNLAERAGVQDLNAFDKCFADTSRIQRVEADLRAGEALKIPGTPGIIMNGKLLASIPSADDLEKLIQVAKSAK